MIRPIDMEKVTKGGIVIPDSIADRAKAETTEGHVAALGPTAYASHDGEPWCKVGDKVLYPKYGANIRVKDPDTGIEYIMINDDDVLCIVTEEEDSE